MARTKQDEDFQVEFVSELPKINRRSESGVWAKRLAPLAEHPGEWGIIHKTEDGKSPHPVTNQLKRGSAAGVNPDDYEFVGRTQNGVGMVFARYLTDEQKAERDAAAEAEGSSEDEGAEA